MKPHEQDIVVRKVAERILEKSRGAGGSGASLWAKDILQPQVDPRRAFLAHVRTAVEQTTGLGDYSYRRPNRRSLPGAPLPANMSPLPRISLILDTSGSMDQRDLALALGLVGKVLKSLACRDGIRVLCGDDGLQTAAKIFDPKRIELQGGGGTNMARLVDEAAAERPRPQLVLVVTDGETPWPANPVGVPVVACLTRPASRYYPVPSWIKQVVLTN